MSTSSVEILGVRHHGPGSARSVVAALEELRPDLVLIEGAPELDALLPLAGAPDLVPPVAGLVYAVDSPRRSSFYPLAAFSPEWVAMRWAVEREVEVHFADLPAAVTLAPEDDADSTPSARRPDPLSELARAAGYDDSERWWEDAIEHRRTSTLERFASLRAAIAEVRADEAEDPENARREAAMRKAIRAGIRAGRERIAFVCGAYHAPALEPDTFPTAAHDNRLLTGLPKTKVAATWAPWTSSRLAFASGYGAGVTSPGWYHHLFVTPDDDVVPAWLVKVAHALRAEQIDASPASVVEATRLAEALAAVRGRPSVGLTELGDATRAVLTEGSELPLALIERTLVIGTELGSVPESTPMVPLAADLARQQRSLRLKPSAAATTVTLDLRKEAQLGRSVLLHRLGLLGIDWGEQVDPGRSTGTFKEAWELEWRPELAVALIEANVHGNTVAAAAEARTEELAGDAEDLAELGRLISKCLVADLPGALSAVVAALAERTARHHDTLALLQTVEPLAQTCRYGDVRGVDVSQVGAVLDTVLTRAAVGLRAACSALDDDAAADIRAAIESGQRGVSLLDREQLSAPWRQALVGVAGDPAIHGSVSGRVNRLLLDAGALPREEAAARLSRRLSTAADAGAAAAWLDGFLAGDALLLLHDEDLLGIVDGWVSEIGETTFEDLLPLLRRTFSRFEAAERRQIGSKVRDIGRAAASPATTDHFDLDRAMPAVATVGRLLGLEAAR
ncbi:DUF5682 family protein [Nocardioides speluncae]|uniref:DUF5682 family protein n=1 Tax=Nocardioides speluncae TaxID=2670337 RepID=UPI000D69D929|nr:DUF5682 family protein [Nocardioides speluncae]